MRKHLKMTAMLIISALLALIFLMISAPEKASATPLVSEAETTEVQMILVHHGYVLVIDGDYGPVTGKAVRHWQRVNGLLPDGIAGPVTISSLRQSINSPPVPAVRMNPPNPTPPLVEDGSIESIIRDVWPDELEDRAVAIAYRESRHIPGVRNYCCFGLFQIYWNVHRGWLVDLGITSAYQLFDARTNATAAYALYQRAGNWGPWSL